MNGKIGAAWMAREQKPTLKITLLSSEKEEIEAMSEECGYGTMSKYVLDCVRAQPLQRHIETSRKIMHTFDRLHEFETSKRYSTYSRKERRALADQIRTTLMDLCRDAGKL